ncbi:hypothetical protein PSI19_15460 [Xenorhabdus khoisanae]|uniref:hypothetical protein n=1 Tax=Xenorhabdus khoisanae TaxID=880157 RepID=UPI0023581059|nr:hypothetical protein [Xenorhabdus khoisanae]MDC9615239.1 hypothetical protein [Xenorhabdus khoisanae]
MEKTIYEAQVIQNSGYNGLFVDGSGFLRKVNPHLSANDIPIPCQCCTHTFNGVPIHR